MAEELKDLVVTKFEDLKGQLASLKNQVETSEKNQKDLFKLDEMKEALKTQVSELLIVADGDKKTGMDVYLKNMQTQLDKIEGEIANQATTGKNKVKSAVQQMQEYFTGDEYKGMIEMKKAGYKMPKDIGFDIKALNITNSIDSIGTNDPQLSLTAPLEPGVNKAPNNPTLFYGLVNKGTVSKEYIAWVERTTVTRNAAMNSENTVYGESAVTFNEAKADVKKITDSMVVTNEALEDIDYAMSEVMELLQYGIPNVRDNEIYAGTGLTTHLTGIDTIAKTFAVPTGVDSVTDPDNVDVLATAVLQCILGNSATDATNIGFAPSAIVVNAIDLHNLKLIREKDGKFKYPELWMPQPVIAGVPVYTSTRVAVGSYQVGDYMMAKYFTRRGMTIRMWDQNGNDPIYDRVTFTASERGVLRVKSHDKFAFVKGTFAASKVLLQAGA